MHEQEWAKLLLKCATLITAAARSLDHMEHTAKEFVAAEVYSAPKTRDYMAGKYSKCRTPSYSHD